MPPRLPRAVHDLTLRRLTVPMAYLRVGLDIAESHGLPREALLRELALDPQRLRDPDARAGLATCARLAARLWRSTGDAALGYEFGLRSSLAAHGNLGFGVVSHPTVGEALEFGLRYGRLRNPVVSLRLRTEAGTAVIEAREALPLGRLRQMALDAVMISVARLARQMSGAFRPQLELCFDCAEPPHFARYRHRLPPVRFDAGANQLRFPAEYLARPLPTGDAAAARSMAERCEQELSLLQPASDVGDRVRALLEPSAEGFVDLASVARRLHLSERTLKRRLQAEGLSYSHLLDEARQRQAKRLLAEPAVRVRDVAQRLGYADPASFTRAFRKWTGRSPRHWRTDDPA